jgi:uncharacterized protein YndB with AHSA1/START domain
MSSRSHTTTTTTAPVVRAAVVNRSPEQAFEIFTEEIGAWWPLPTHGLFGDRAGGVAFADGRLVEQHVDGTEAVWGTVLSWEPPDRLVFTWHPGRDEADASEVEVLFTADGTGTRVVLEHRGWESFGREAMARRRSYVGPSAWGHVLDHYGDVAEARTDAADLAGLAEAYAAFFAEAERGPFGPAPSGEFDADQVLAHVAINDAAMVAVCQSLVHRSPIPFTNDACHDRAALARWTAVAASRGGPIAAGRARARQVMAALARLSPEQLATEVTCTLLHDGQVVVDQALPWGAVAIETQAERHLPGHLDQLRGLRTGA